MQLVRIGDLLARRKDPIFIQDNSRYKRVTIRINHNGVCLRNEEMGKKIGTKRQFITRAGDFILSRIDARHAAFGIVPPELDGAIITNDFWTFEINKEMVDLEYFYIFSQSAEFLEACKKASKGTTNRKRIEQNFFLNYEFRLPDLVVQHEIVDRYNSAKILYDNLYEDCASQKPLIEQLLQSILMDLLKGKLLASEQDEETAEMLLKRIAQERAIAGKKVRMKSIADVHGLFPLPQSWKWCRLREVIIYSEAGKSLQCDNHPVQGSEWGIIKTSAITSSEFIEDENKFFSKSEPRDVSKRISIGDLIFCRASGSKGLAGKCCVVKKLSKKLLLNDKTIRIITSNKIISEYINLYNNSPIAKKYYLSLTTDKSTSMNNIKRDQLLDLPIPLPPLSTQRRIIDKLNLLIRYFDSLKLEGEAQLNKANKFMELLLRDLFKDTVG